MIFSIIHCSRAWAAAHFVTLVIAMVAMDPSACRSAPADPDPDACKSVPMHVVGALITTRDDVVISSKASHPVPGKSTCIWSVVQKGLTDDAPPDARLTLAFYHFASPVRASSQMQKLAKVMQPLSLVHTEDPQDQVLRTDADTAIARHGSDIAVVDASQATGMTRQRSWWTYRLEALAFAAAGSRVIGPVDARATAPLCDLVGPDHVLALLTLSPSTLQASIRPEDDGLRCSFDVKDASRDIAGWTKNHGSAQFRREDLGTNAAALARLHADRPFDRPSTLVATTEQTDQVVPTPDHPEEVEAVHGPYLVTLNLTGPTDAARTDPTWTYRVQRTALEAAGATIVLKPGMAADPVTPGPTPAPAAFAWRTSDHVAPAWSALSDPLVHILVLLARHRFIVMPGLIGGSILLAAFRSSPSKRRVSTPAVIGNDLEPPSRKARGWVLTPLCIGFAVLNLIFGTQIGGLLVYDFGAEAQATITGSHGTSTVYNNHNVRGYDVLIKTADGVVETGFEDDDFNVYPPHNATRYPDDGDEFNVRYLQHFPGDFVILGEDGSPWAHDAQCATLGSLRAQAEAKLKFAPDMTRYREALDAAVRAEAEAGCEGG